MVTSFDKPRRQRTTITSEEKEELQEEFETNPKPSKRDFKAIAERLNIKQQVVRTWFCNRRQKLRNEGWEDEEREESSSPLNIASTTLRRSIEQGNITTN